MVTLKVTFEWTRMLLESWHNMKQDLNKQVVIVKFERYSLKQD